MKKLIAIASMIWVLAGCSATPTREMGDTGAELYYKAEKQYQDGSYQEARNLYLSLNEKLPNNELILFRLANIAMQLGEVDSARTYYQAVLKVNPRNEKAHHNLAVLHVLQASRYFNYYLALSPKGDMDSRLVQLMSKMQDYIASEKPMESPLDKLANAMQGNRP